MFTVTLTPCREDQDRYWSLVSYEVRGNHPDDFWLKPVRKTYRWIDTGRGWRFTCVGVMELRNFPGLRGREWVRTLPPAPEPEELRRDRIRALRRAIHVDREKGNAEPNWKEPIVTLTGPKLVPIVSAPCCSQQSTEPLGDQRTTS